MGVTLPPALDGFLEILGVPWPNIDEDEIRKDAAAWRTVQAQAAPAGAEADTAVRRTQQVYRGDSATVLASHWNRVGGDGGHLAQAAAAARIAPVALDGTANVVSAVKVAVGVQAASALVNVTQLVMFGGAVGATAAAARMFLTRQAIGKILREGGEGTGKVLAPALSRRVTGPMRDILENLRRLGGPGGSPVAVGPGGLRLPVRPGGLRTPSGPRHDGIALMGRNNRGSGGGRGSGGRGRPSGRSRWGARDGTGKFHHDVPTNTRGLTKEQMEKLAADLARSIKVRERERDRFGILDPGHEGRLKQEQKALKMLRDKLKEN
jgi:hypothetical protein